MPCVRQIQSALTLGEKRGRQRGRWRPQRRRAQLFDWALCFLWVLRKYWCLLDVLGSRSGFTAVQAPPSHLVTSLAVSFLDAANDALGRARKAARAAATPIFVIMLYLPLEWSKMPPLNSDIYIIIFIQDQVCTDHRFSRNNVLISTIFTDVHVTMNAGS